MAHRKFDLVQETSTSTGTGNMALGGAVTRRRAFSAVLSNADTCYVLIENASAAEWEICLATYVSAGNQLSRGAVLASSTGSAVSFSAGTKTISLIAPASKAIVEDNNGDASVTRHLTVTGSVYANGSQVKLGGSGGSWFWFDYPNVNTLRLSSGASPGTGPFAFTDSGKFGIGTTAPRGNLEISTSNATFTLNHTAGAADEKTWDFYTNTQVLTLRVLNDAYSASNAAWQVGRSGYTVNYQAWYTGSTTEAMRLNSSGLGIGVTPTVKLHAKGADSVSVCLLAGVSKGVRFIPNTTEIRIEGVDNTGVGSYQPMVIGGSTLKTSTHLTPENDNVYNSGSALLRWAVVYAGTGTINTSGRDAKVGIREPSVAERAAARRILDAGPKLYRFKDAVDEKGEAARLHAGYIAEDVRDALEAEGLDPWRYAFLCADPVMVTEEYTETVTRPKFAKVQAEERAVEMIEGRPVMVTKTVEREEPVGRMVPVVDQDGEPVMVPGGEPDAEGNVAMVPMLHFVQDAETATETRTREVPLLDTAGNPVMRLGLRYSELEAFLKCAAAAR